MHIGIDLGTTFCCVAYVDDDGIVKIIPNSDKEETTPSVVCFDGKTAYVGKKANGFKPFKPQQIYEFIKRDIGKPVQLPPDYVPDDSQEIPECRPFEIDGFKYGALGMSAIVLRKLKIDAIRFFKRIDKLPKDLKEKEIELDAVITVPAYFGDKERQETRLAGYAAGLNVIGVINEPTAAALTYGLDQRHELKVMVFDLGGGTFDVTLLQVNNGEANVIASDGANTLGGKDWDELIQSYLYEEFYRLTESFLPDSGEEGFEIQKLSLQAKHELSARSETEVILTTEDGEETVIKLCRSAPKDDFDEYDLDVERPFYFDERAGNLLTIIRTVCLRLMEQAGWQWGDFDEILLAGGSSRMPMILDLIKDLSGREVKPHIEGFNYDTAIATGAALYGQHKGKVKDVMSHSVGVKYMQDGMFFVEHLLKKDSRLPLRHEECFHAQENASLVIYEGESKLPDECTLRGRLELNNPEGEVTVIMEADTNGILKAIADFQPDGSKVLELKNELFEFNERVEPVREKVQGILIKV